MRLSRFLSLLNEARHTYPEPMRFPTGSVMAEQFIQGDVADNRLSFLKNPLGPELVAFLSRNHMAAEARGYMDAHGNVFVWYARLGTHHLGRTDLIDAGLIDPSEANSRETSVNLYLSIRPTTDAEPQWADYLQQFGTVWIGASDLGPDARGRGASVRALAKRSEPLRMMLASLRRMPVQTGLTESIRSITISPVWRDPFRMLLLVNPSPVELDRMIVDGSSQQDVRVMLCEGRLYAWDAGLCAHNEVIQTLDMNTELVDGRIRTAIMHVTPDAIMFSHFDVLSGFLKTKNDPYGDHPALKLGFSPEDQRWWLAQPAVRKMLANYPIDESLTESWTHGIIHNPSVNAINNLLQAVPGNIVKGLIDANTKEAWVGSGYHHTHAGIAKQLGLDDSNLTAFVISASTEEPGRFGVIELPPNRTTMGLSTNTDHNQLKQNWFFQLPWIARLNWADVEDRSWREAWT